MATCAGWAAGTLALSIDSGDSLGFGGGGSAMSVQPGADESVFTPYIQSCDGLRFSATDQLCPFGGNDGLAPSGGAAGFARDPSDDDSFYTPLTQSCDYLRFSGTDELCPFGGADGLGSGIDLAADGGFYTPLTQSCDGLRFSGTDEICPLTGPDLAGGSPTGAPAPDNQDSAQPGGGNAPPSGDPSGQVDAPATLALMGLGLLILGFAQRRGRRAVSA